jgi:hypothetical protein
MDRKVLDQPVICQTIINLKLVIQRMVLKEVILRIQMLLHNDGIKLKGMKKWIVFLLMKIKKKMNFCLIFLILKLYKC